MGTGVIAWVTPKQHGETDSPIQAIEVFQTSEVRARWAAVVSRHNILGAADRPPNCIGVLHPKPVY